MRCRARVDDASAVCTAAASDSDRTTPQTVVCFFFFFLPQDVDRSSVRHVFALAAAVQSAVGAVPSLFIF